VDIETVLMLVAVAASNSRGGPPLSRLYSLYAVLREVGRLLSAYRGQKCGFKGGTKMDATTVRLRLPTGGHWAYASATPHFHIVYTCF